MPHLARLRSKIGSRWETWIGKVRFEGCFCPRQHFMSLGGWSAICKYSHSDKSYRLSVLGRCSFMKADIATNKGDVMRWLNACASCDSFVQTVEAEISCAAGATLLMTSTSIVNHITCPKNESLRMVMVVLSFFLIWRDVTYENSVEWFKRNHISKWCKLRCIVRLFLKSQYHHSLWNHRFSFDWTMVNGQNVCENFA